MPKKYCDIDLFKLIHSLERPIFTVTDLTQKLMNTYPDTFRNKKNSRQFVFRTLKKLAKNERLTEKGIGVDNALRYELKKSSDEKESVITDQINTSTNSEHKAIRKKLEEKIKFYETEMLARAGEAEAYDEWIKEMPDHEELIQSYFQEARLAAKRLYGKRKAFENLLSMHKATSL